MNDSLPFAGVELDDAYPLAQLQAGMLFHSEYHPETAVYHDIFSFHLCAPLVVPAFERATLQLIDRHPILRTSFDLTSFSEPLQLVHRHVAAPLQIEDISHLSEEEQEKGLDAWFELERQHAFDWKQPPLWRFYIHRRSAETFQFTLSFHHAILDGWSVASLLTELFQRYMAVVDQLTEAEKVPLSAAFRDFVALEREASTSDKARLFWLQKLDECVSIRLPRMLTQVQTTAPQAKVHSLSLALEESQQLGKLAQELAVPLKSVLLAAHLVVMRLLSGQNDILTGLVTNGRPETTDGERALGLFLNTLPYRQKLSGGNWRKLILDTFETERELLPFRRYPLALIQRDCGRQELFETAFNFIHFHVYQSLQRHERLTCLTSKTFEQTNFTLISNFSLDPVSSQIHLFLEYDASALSESQIQVIGIYYANAIQAMLAHPEDLYQYTDLLTAQERSLLLSEWNNTIEQMPQEHDLATLFEAQVKQTPDAVAITFGNTYLTYQIVNQRSNQLAHYLCEMGVGPDKRVGICLESSVDTIISILGILKAGGAYVPLDPRYPEDRLEFITRDANLKVLITQDKLKQKTHKLLAATIFIEQIDQMCVTYPTINLARSVNRYNLAYIIYTSGSTGMPKGVMMCQRPLLNLIVWHKQQQTLGRNARTLQFTSLSFDVAFQEIFSTLCTGGTLFLLKEEIRRSLEDIVTVLAEEQIERIFLPFIALQHIASIAGKQQPDLFHLSEIITAGEQLQMTEPIMYWLRQLKTCSLHNHYGPSESHVVTAFTLPEAPDYWPSLPPIGRPIANTKIYVLDQYLQPVPIGTPGELYIGGICLARGYLGRPDVTGERFLPHPFGIEPGERIYQTGDSARYLPDGCLEFLGRTDLQIKIRGFRVEPGEIEVTLSKHPAVKDAVVVAHENELGEKSLAAYICMHAEQQLTTVNQLRGFLEKSLPDYMIPAAFVFLDALPLTPTGKVQRNALPAPKKNRPDVDEVFVAPRTVVEQLLAEIWADVLKLERVGINANFLALGGHSLLALQLIARVRMIFQVQIPLRWVFEKENLGELAQAIAQQSTMDGVSLERLLTALEQLPEGEVTQLLDQN